MSGEGHGDDGQDGETHRASGTFTVSQEMTDDCRTCLEAVAEKHDLSPPECLALFKCVIELLSNKMGLEVRADIVRKSTS